MPYRPKGLQSAEALWSRMFPYTDTGASLAEIMSSGYWPDSAPLDAGNVLIIFAADGVGMAHVAEHRVGHPPVLEAFRDLVATVQAVAAPITRKAA